MKKKLYRKQHHFDKQLLLKIGTLCFMVFAVAVILFPIQKTASLQEVDFVRNSQQLQGVHGAASQWDYLFEDTNTQTYT